MEVGLHEMPCCLKGIGIVGRLAQDRRKAQRLGPLCRGSAGGDLGEVMLGLGVRHLASVTPPPA